MAETGTITKPRILKVIEVATLKEKKIIKRVSKGL